MDTKDKLKYINSEKMNAADPIDEQLLARFFEQNRPSIPDDGFTNRVMKAIEAQPELSNANSQLSLVNTLLNWLAVILSVAFFIFVGGPQLIWQSILSPFFSALAALLPIGIFNWTADDWLVAFFRNLHHLVSIDIMSTPLPAIYLLIIVLTAISAKKLALLT